MGTYPLRKPVPDATMASVCFLLPPGSLIIYLGGKMKFSFFFLFFFFRVGFATVKTVFSPYF